MTKAVWGARIRLAGVLLITIGSASCGDMTRQGTASSYIIVRTVEVASGADDTTFKAFLLSDVETVIDGSATYFNDPARAEFSLGMKDPGTAASPSQPSQANWITVNRYHVKYIRADGRNVQGVDVPYEFDGGLQVTINGDVDAGFNLVRHVAKREAPLAALARNGIIISTIAEITFYGHDQTGREVSATARVNVEFGNFADPKS